MRAFARTALLILVHDTAHNARVPNIDQLSAGGITTALTASSGTDVSDEVVRVVGGAAAADAVRVAAASEAARVFTERDHGARVYIVDAGESLLCAGEVLRCAEEQLEGSTSWGASRVGNAGGGGVTGGLLKGVLVWGGERWDEVVPASVREMGDWIGVPRQSCGDGGGVVGMVVWGGKGLARCDERKWLWDGVPAGDGRLSVQGVVAEVLAKTGVVPKYGA